ncbi:MAG: universal stress protein, partial [Cyanobacteria bacterium P01_F01_bin.3]
SKDRILVPIDFSEESLAALKETIAFAEDNAKVYALYVLKPLEATEPGMVWDAIDSSKRRENVTQLFNEKFPPATYEGLNFAIEEGDPSAEIIDYAQAEKMELIVMPSRGRTGISRFFIGSTAERVVRLAHCPVLVFKE